MTLKLMSLSGCPHSTAPTGTNGAKTLPLKIHLSVLTKSLIWPFLQSLYIVETTTDCERPKCNPILYSQIDGLLVFDSLQSSLP